MQKPSKLRPLSFIYTESWYENFSLFGDVGWMSFERFVTISPKYSDDDEDVVAVNPH
jgi:hypothetical protein